MLISAALLILAFFIGLQLTIWPTPNDIGIEHSSKKTLEKLRSNR